MARLWMMGTCAGLAVLAGCATEYEEAAERGFGTTPYRIERGPAEEPPKLDGSFESYLAYAMRHSPELEASFERWRAATLRISRARRLPEPTISFTYFIRSVETRVGPQHHRLSLRQAFPWPTKLSAGADAAALTARAAEERFEALATTLQERVARVYWRLWAIHRSHHIFLEQEQVLASLAESVRARVETGGANLADLSQVHLRLERHRDHHGAHAEAMRQTSAALVAVIGAPPGTPTPIDDEPAEGLPAEDFEALLADALTHPRIRSHELMARAAEAQAEAADAERYPNLVLGLDWIQTGEDPAGMTNVPGNGKDPVMASAAVSLPLWGGSYDDAADAARAESAAAEAESRATQQLAASELEEALSEVRDAQRRIDLYREVLIPDARSVHASLTGGMAAGGATLAQVLMSERDLLSLRLDLMEARAEHARAWASLERVVGRDVSRKGAGEAEDVPIPEAIHPHDGEAQDE